MIKFISLILTIMFLTINVEAAEIIESYGHAVFGELKYKKDFKHFEYVDPSAPKRGKVNLYSLGSFDSLNQFLLKGNSAPALSFPFDTLMTSSLDEPYSTYGLVAESIRYPRSKKWVEYTIREEAKWHDGKPITAHDIKFTLETLKEKGNPNYKIVYKDITVDEIKDDKIIRFILASPDNPLLISHIGGLPILPKHFFKDKDFAKFDTEPILGSGPYKIKEYEFGKYIIYERVDDYWAKDLNVVKGHFNFDEIRYDVYFDTQIAIEAFKGGEYDFRQENISRAFATSYNIDEVMNGEIVKESISHKLPANLQATFINTRKPMLKDVNLRFAMNQAFDFDWMNKALFYDAYKRISIYFENTDFAATGLPSEAELKIMNKFKEFIPPKAFTHEFKHARSKNDPLENRNNLKKVLNILLENGYKIEGNNLISPITNKKIEIEVMYFTPQFERVFNAWKNNLAKIGITLNLRFLDQAQYFKRVQDFDFDIATFAFAPVTIPGDNQIQLWHSKSDIKGGFNFAGIHNPAVDYVLGELKNAKTKEEMITYTRVLDRILLWNYYAIPQLYSDKFRLLYWNKFGIPDIRPEYDIGFLTWWLK